MSRKGKDNPNWRGGRITSSHGYVLIRVGKEHHLADIRGYAYEHRLVAERKLGRRLKQGELVHHLNDDRMDNQPENLSIVDGNAEHYVHYRNRQDLRLPGEANSVIKCECGCGETFEKFDANGRPRRYVSGHNLRLAPTQLEILEVLGCGGLHRDQIASLCGKSVGSVATALSKLKQKGCVIQIGCGVWALREAI